MSPSASDTVRLTLPDGSTREVPRGTTAGEAAASIGRRLARDAVAAVVDGKPVDLFHRIESDAAYAVVTKDSPEGLRLLRHTCAHILAQAVIRTFGPTRLWVGPPLDEGAYGFYYDMELEHTITPEDLPPLEKEIEKIIAEDYVPERFELPAGDALARMRKEGQPFKVDLIEGFGLPTVSFYTQGEFTDLCEGPHLPRTGLVGGVKLMAVTGAYYKGDSDRPMLQRVYGNAFYSRKELEDHLARLEEAKKRDHRRLGPQLGIFRVDPISPGSPFWLPKGAWLYNALVDYVRGLYPKYGYREVITPQVFKTDLWKTSGHADHFADDMFTMEAEEATYGLKPMNCPGHAYLFGTEKHSYRELPLRIAEFTRLHRYELSGTLSGLHRVRAFAQDDAHIFCTPEQIDIEFDRFLEMVREIYADLGLERVEVHLATCPENYAGTSAMRTRAEDCLKQGLERAGIDYGLHEGEGTFYAPKVEWNFRDVLDRVWTLSTIQVDFVMPQRFGLKYTDADGAEKCPVMLHRAILGSLERFIGVYLEHTGGDFPLWLAPVQARVMPITDDQNDVAESVAASLREAGLRAETDLRHEKIGYKIREAELERVPYMLVVGKREAETGTVSVRHRQDGDRGATPVGELVRHMEAEVRSGRAKESASAATT